MPQNKNSKARIAANNRYNNKAYDRINIAVAKGEKEKINAHAEAMGESLNKFVKRAIDETITRDEEKAALIQPKPAESEEGRLPMPWEEEQPKQQKKTPKTIEELLEMQRQHNYNQEETEEDYKMPWDE